MPDVQIICTSSAEYDLRFYDTSAGKFELRILVSQQLKNINLFLKN